MIADASPTCQLEVGPLSLNYSMKLSQSNSLINQKYQIYLYLGPLLIHINLCSLTGYALNRFPYWQVLSFDRRVCYNLSSLLFTYHPYHHHICELLHPCFIGSLLFIRNFPNVLVPFVMVSWRLFGLVYYLNQLPISGRVSKSICFKSSSMQLHGSL